MKKGHFLFSVISFSAILPLLVFLSLCSLAEGEGKYIQNKNCLLYFDITFKYPKQ